MEFLKSESLENKNLFLIDWLSVTCYGCSEDDVLDLIGMRDASIPWEIKEKFLNGYPMRCFFDGISILYGADQEQYFKDPTKVRQDMGICLQMSGQGCRAFESYGHGDWFRLLSEFFTIRDSGYKEKDGRKYSYNITRLDLAFDDHTGLLDIFRIRDDVEHRYYTSKSKFSQYTWSDDQNEDIQGLSITVGSNTSDIKIRIYDKAAERGFKDQHWIRVELQLRDDRSSAAASELIASMHIGNTVRGILANYLNFREPGNDTNRSRWEIAAYWKALLEGMAAVSLWHAPGVEYNISRTEFYLKKQYGQMMVVLDELHDPFYLLDQVKREYPIESLAPKYRQLISQFRPFKNFDPVSAPEVDQIFPVEYTQLKLEDEDA